MANETNLGIGDTLEDKITGFIGVAMAKTEYFTGCIHFGLLPRGLKDGKTKEWEWFDSTRLVIVPGTEKVLMQPIKRLGGPAPNAPTI